ncbi:MAG: hypothetical protein AAF149_19290 [Bacteroidota bacterium]
MLSLILSLLNTPSLSNMTDDIKNKGVTGHEIERGRRFTLQLKFIAIAITLLSVIIIALISISEITTRQHMISMLKVSIREYKDKQLESYKELSQVKKSDSLYGINRGEVYNTIEANEKIIRAYQVLLNDATDLYRNGALSKTDVSNEIQYRINSVLYSSIDDKNLSPTGLLYSAKIFLGIYHINSDMLVAYIIISCAILGSLIGNFRTYDRISIRNIAVGIGTGFITFLTIKGGKSVFLLEFYQKAPLPLNPYSVAFAAILAGLFSDRFFTLLSSIVDKIFDQIRSAMESVGN